ncbi:MAG: hypothetical protein O4861_02110 [Trichodesmium sp. St16_bin4-tuft]|nr:hypothetical protein [Trichodesmium sp. MAG_R01]MDE5072088.1 hypothetical protein [Trichodesmium sp. St5_bin8]MDE5079647.1 hypothetical protein [Trichodesmium sp. St2_bin6]MDE5097195.1 hypothetical protein [Trichodesmium sp. St16_bin4-tuft]MDE5101449.1 hypothetical protein [Trichodesmium sp. St19_bin2]
MVGYIKYKYLVLNPERRIKQLQDFTGLNLGSFIKNYKCQGSKISYSQLSDTEKPWYS